MITATLDDLADMDDDDDDDKDEDVDNGDDDAAASLLQSSSQSTPPDCIFEIQSARNAAVAEAERQRLEKVRKRGESMMSRGLREHSPSTTSSLVGGGRMLSSSNKRTKRDASSPAVAAVAVAGHMNNRYADDN
jgi:hypothetical protein